MLTIRLPPMFKVREPASQPIAERPDARQQKYGATATGAQRHTEKPFQPADIAPAEVQGGQHAEHGRRRGILQDPSVFHHRQRNHQPRGLAQEPTVKI